MPGPQLTVQQMRQGIERLKLRIADLENFDPQAVARRWAPEVKALETSIGETLAAVYGPGTVEYNRYRLAAKLDSGPMSAISYERANRAGQRHPNDNFRHYLKDGKQRALALLQQAVRGLEEEIACRGEPPVTAATSKHSGGHEIILKLADRLPQVIRQLNRRHDNRKTLDVEDEYDVQDLLHALLKIDFDDIRPEEWTPSYAGSSARMDFFLPEANAVVETKMTRRGLTASKLGDELILDITRYQNHPGCKTLYCVVYDPNGRTANPRGIENDLTKDHDNLKVCVRIVPT